MWCVERSHVIETRSRLKAKKEDNFKNNDKNGQIKINCIEVKQNVTSTAKLFRNELVIYAGNE